MTDKQKKAIEAYVTEYNLTIFNMVEFAGTGNVFMDFVENDTVEGFDPEGYKPLDFSEYNELYGAKAT